MFGRRGRARATRSAATAARETALLRWDVKVLAAELAQQRYAAGLAGPGVELPVAPTRVCLTSRVCRQADIEHAWLRHWCGRLHMAPLYHRKVWEDAFVLQALWEAGMIAPGRRGLGFAVGREMLPAFLAGAGVAVVATDLDPADARARAWSRSGQHAGEREGLYQGHLVGEADFARLVTHRVADMTAIPDDLADGGFDFVWSVCALEHLGTLEAGLDFVLAAMRCLRPGGVAVHTMEFNLDGAGGTIEDGPTVLFQRRHLDTLAARLAAAGHAMLALDDGGAEPPAVFDRFVDLPPYPHEPWSLGPLWHAPHLRLALEGYPVTSVGIVAKAGPTAP
ncbi:MAG: class I SAM-dependent methyltransferase [Acetobacteraceae bacterium]|nr:class I SAM-dependent methyltransferase [Acetobacteraceae bacterium]